MYSKTYVICEACTCLICAYFFVHSDKMFQGTSGAIIYRFDMKILRVRCLLANFVNFGRKISMVITRILKMVGSRRRAKKLAHLLSQNQILEKRKRNLEKDMSSMSTVYQCFCYVYIVNETWKTGADCLLLLLIQIC